MSTEIHCCVLNKCTGSKYAKWFIQCKFCNNPVFIECMRNRNDLVKSILVGFSLARVENDTLVIQSSSSNRKMVKGFMSCFDVNSPFGITCEVCTDKFKRMMNDVNPGSSSLSQVRAQNAQNNSNQMRSADEIASLPDDTITSQKSDCWEIFVSSFPAKAECEQITAHIVGKTDLQAVDFKVTQMVSPRIKPKYRKFMSFKITAHDQATYDIILDVKVWEPFATAVPFNTEAKSESRQRKQRQKQKQNNQPSQAKPATKMQPPVSMKQEAQPKPAPAREPVVNRKKQQSAKKPNDRVPAKPQIHQQSNKSSGLSACHCHCLANNAKGKTKMKNASSDFHRGSDFPGRPVRGLNFHGRRWNNHRPLDNDLKSLVSLLTRVLDRY